MTDQPDPDAWQAYAADIAKAIRSVRLDAITVEAFRERLDARPTGVSSDVRTDIINLLYEEPSNPSADDLADLNRVLKALEDGASYDEVMAILAIYF